MQYSLNVLKLLADSSRLRIVLLLKDRELCVCQIMGVLNISQPLVSKNLSMLREAGLLKSRKDGKQVYYCLKKRMKQPAASIINELSSALIKDRIYISDITSMKECEEFQKKTGKCGMQGLKEFMKHHRKSK
ncbi:MAG: metalloregulator ArsR/SmtB family transcription factor [Dissulfurispiraceae bacterium]|jgi:ArsR family transcriptional regulator|nr:metalloregulator ArsR/SmtB family transcription factor [Dissulfurispiraceae bacterium]